MLIIGIIVVSIGLLLWLWPRTFTAVAASLLILAGSLYALDAVWGWQRHYTTNVRTEVFDGPDNGFVVFSLAGWSQPGLVVGKILAEGSKQGGVRNFATLVAFDAPESGYSLDDMYQELLRWLEQLRPRVWGSINGSWGGQVYWQLMERYHRDGMERLYGKPLPPVFDSTPGNTSDIKMPQWGYWAMPHLGHGPIFTAIKAFAFGRMIVPPQHPDPGLDPALHSHLVEGMCWVPWPGAAAQARLMGDFDITKRAKNPLIETIHFIKSPGKGDGLIRNKQAVKHWRHVAKVVVHEDDGRAELDHNTVLRPSFIAGVLGNLFAQARR